MSKKALAIFLLLLPLSALPQAVLEEMEFSGVVTAIDPGFSFALERLTLDVKGKEEPFLFYPNYGNAVFEKIRIGMTVTVKANVNPKSRRLYDDLDKRNKAFSWFLRRDHITEIKTETDKIVFTKPTEQKSTKAYKVFLDRKVVDLYSEKGLNSGLILGNGVIAFNQGITLFFDRLKDVKKNDSVSFIGFKMEKKDGYRYPIERVNEVYYFTPLQRESGYLKSLLFKQNHACIGLKFKTKSGELKVSIPSDMAVRLKDFLKTDVEAKIYYGPYSDLDKLILPELHGIVQGRDTLLINDFGFYGGADGKHDFQWVLVEGKISHIDKTPKGNIESIVVDSEYYIEIDAMMAQQLGHMFQKGKKVTIQGKERIKKKGEIYSKKYRIVTPEKLTIDDRTFSAFRQ
ncbi:hypothetical protein WSM22_08550 [Cytophagales bacterium WSM2-2]|nr:hypothetical protein WSM22_08550 [Cytophagales bacterium WSM2-2]